MNKLNVEVWYHSNCLDGFGAAYAAWLQFGDDAIYRAVQYGYPPPEASLPHPESLDVLYIVDFSFNYETMLKLGEKHKKVIVLDHHKTAMENLGGKEFPSNVRINLTMDRSGAMMAWQFFHPSKPVPNVIAHIQDRDLWQWKLFGTKEVTAALDSYPKVFETWKHLLNDRNRLYTEGVAISRYREQQIAILVNAWSRSPWTIKLAGVEGPLINGPYFLTSELLHELGKEHPFAANIIYTKDMILFSLRSGPDGADVAAIAQKYGGGGHKHAAGFSLTSEELKAVQTIGETDGVPDNKPQKPTDHGHLPA